MNVSEVPTTDSGYPTPRDDLPSSSRSASPRSSPDEHQLTSTPVRGRRNMPMKEHFSHFRHDLSIIESTGSDSISTANDSNVVIGIVPQHYYRISFPLDSVKSLLAVSKELKKKSRENTVLRGENETLRGENESLREENCSLRETSRRTEMDKSISPEMGYEGVVFPVIPRLQLHDASKENDTNTATEHPMSSDDIKKELLSIIKSEEDRTILESKMENMVISDSKPSAKVFTGTATIQLNTEKIDADVQTENDDHVKIVNANLQIEVDQLHSEIEIIGKRKSDLENRLFDYEKMKAKFEEDEQKLRSDLEKKLKTSQAQIARSEAKNEELQARLNSKKKEVEEISAENRRLLEDKNTHEFEMDEMKVHEEHLMKQNSDLEVKLDETAKKVNDLEDALKEEKFRMIQFEKEAENTAKDFELSISGLKKKADEALEKETEAMKKLEEIRKQNKELVKENKYLSDSQHVLLDSEINSKNEINVLQANIRNIEAQLSVAKDQIAEEKRHKELLNEDVTRLEIQNQKLIEDKYDSNELMDELKKGKLEIDHLRQQVQLLSQESNDVAQLKEELQSRTGVEQRLREKLEQALRKEGESDVKIEGYIRSEAAATAELERLKVELAEQTSVFVAAQQELTQKEATILELERAFEALRIEFEEFKADANAQYENEIFVREQELNHLRARLIELETYPGHTISVSRQSKEVQTDDIVLEETTISPSHVVEEQVLSPVVSPVSEELIPRHLIRLDEKLNRLIEKLKQVGTVETIGDTSADNQLSPLYQSSETVKQIVEILESVLLDSQEKDNQSSNYIDNFWASLNKRAEHLVQIMEEKFETAHREYGRNVQKIDQKWKMQNEKLRMELDKANALSEQRVYLATQFREQYEMEEKMKDEALAEIERLVGMRDEELAEWENNEKDLRKRLERAEHAIQVNARDKLNRTEEFEAELEHLTTRLQKSEVDHNRKVKEFEKQIHEEKGKRAFERESLKRMHISFDNTLEQCGYLRKRNTSRQKLLNHMHAFLHGINLGNCDESMRKRNELIHRVENSGLLKLNRDEIDDERIDRRILGEPNRSQ
ncbi:hypothetical protein GCK72_010497 [Caenorhabditis remanei]|uniref:Uncharacterized protein n=1 Tax=Caenorhabditis remanei TaxID=31234 RepID=A0A6A5H5A4_CAERE|nr:hypothetical protein GCK72_010497 [Caenorhabditis remanei]KAF1762235.1 hypothetical protein GCK72_010497 [Caenorhabditis remanei]